MMDDSYSVDLSLIWGNLRNLVDFEHIKIPGDIKIVGTTVGEFPIDSYRPILLEEKKKKNIAGRINRVFVGMKNTTWEHSRVIKLPIYHNNNDVSVEKLGMIIKHWRNALMPDEIPCIAIAVGARGYYCDERESQSLLVLVLWHDAVGKILELDWAEGPLEDCITPEWYLKSTDLLSLDNALGEVKKTCKHFPAWENLEFSICVSPSCLGDNLQGKKAATSQKAWHYEWKYQKHDNLIKDLNLVLDKTRDIFTMKNSPYKIKAK